MDKSKIKLGVSLYSYQDNYYFKRYDLEGCVAAAAGAGATGIEVFPEAMFPEWPYISDSFIDKWNGMLTRYGVEPVCVDHFSDTRMWKNKNLTDDELYERGVLYIKTAARLGAHSIRLMHDEHAGSVASLRGSDYHLTTVDIATRLLPVARDYDVMMCLECHAPTHIADPVHQPYLEAAEKLGIPNIGLQVDFSSYEYCTSTADLGKYERRGATREILDFIRSQQIASYEKGDSFSVDSIRDQLMKMNPNKIDMEFINNSHDIAKVPASYQELEDYASKVVYIHGKFYDILENGEVDNMDYQKIFNALVKGGYEGYISSEFEGNRRMNDAGWVDEIEYVRKHQVLMRKCLANAK